MNGQRAMLLTSITIFELLNVEHYLMWHPVGGCQFDSLKKKIQQTIILSKLFLMHGLMKIVKAMSIFPIICTICSIASSKHF